MFFLILLSCYSFYTIIPSLSNLSWWEIVVTLVSESPKFYSEVIFVNYLILLKIKICNWELIKLDSFENKPEFLL